MGLNFGNLDFRRSRHCMILLGILRCDVKTKYIWHTTVITIHKKHLLCVIFSVQYITPRTNLSVLGSSDTNRLVYIWLWFGLSCIWVGCNSLGFKFGLILHGLKSNLNSGLIFLKCLIMT